MEVSIFLGRALGIYLVIIGLSMLLNARTFITLFRDFQEESAGVTITAFISIILGILMVLVHNIWVADWRVVITLLAWLTLIKGIIRLNFPHAVPRTMTYFKGHTITYYILTIFCILLGLFLLLFSFVSFGQ